MTRLKIMWFMLNWLCCWADMICGLIGVVTFTVYRPWWDFSIRAWGDKKLLRRRMVELEDEI